MTPTERPRGQFYLDLYSRLHKRGGAWMDECVSRRVTAEGVQLPVAYFDMQFHPAHWRCPIAAHS